LNNFRGSSRDPLLYLRAFSVLLLFILVFGLTFSPASGDSLPARPLAQEENGVNQKNLFIGQGNLNSPEYYYSNITQDDSLIALTVPIFITPRVLGSVSGEGEASNSDLESDNGNKEVLEYIVQSGDTLSSLAEKFGISVNTIIWANDFQENSKISPDQELLILPVSGVLHYVKKGETLGQIAQTYKSKIDKIADFNELSDEDIFAGDILIIPDGVMPTSPKSAPKTFTQQSSDVPLANSYFILPTGGKLSQGLHWYNAVDIASACGTPVYSAAEGKVIKVKFGNTGLGYYIVVSHPNGTTTYYGHLSSILVTQGQEVSSGHIIALMGGRPGTPGAGNSTGCHLHFEVHGARNPFAP
jgi:murein DD-endopeptidase MepM/ murein hydrolase activator NlpD